MYVQYLTNVIYVAYGPGFRSPVNSSITETKAHVSLFIPGFRLNLEKEEKFAEPHVVHSELKRPVCNARGANEDEVLTVRPPQFLAWKRP